MGFLEPTYDRFLEFSFRSSQFCSLLVYVTLPLRIKRFPTYIFFLNFSEYEYYITGGLFLSSLSLSASSLWPNLLKSLPGFTDSSNCVIHASASSSKFIFHLHSGDHFKGSIEDRVSLDYYTWKRLEFNFGDLNGRAEACLTLDDAEV